MQHFQVITWKDKDLLKKVVAITCTLEKMFFAIDASDGLWVVCFTQSKKITCSILGINDSYLVFQIKPSKYCLWEVNFFSVCRC